MKKIMFSDKIGLTQAVLDGRKTMTRRIVPDKLIEHYDEWRSDVECIALPPGSSIETLSEYLIRHAPYDIDEGVVIAQSYQSVYNEFGLETMDCLIQSMKYSKGWSNKMFVKSELMPHHIRITDIKVERLQDISEEDCLKEGIYQDSGDDQFPPSVFYEYENNTDDGFDTAKEAFASLIDKISGKGTWNRNPYVWVYEFELID